MLALSGLSGLSGIMGVEVEMSNAFGPIATVDGINLKVVATTPLYTVPAGKTFICTGFTVRPSMQTAPNNNAMVDVTRLSDSSEMCPFTGAMNCPVGGNIQGSPALNSMFANQFFSSASAGDVVLLNVSAGDTGTTNTASVDLFGYLV